MCLVRDLISESIKTILDLMIIHLLISAMIGERVPTMDIKMNQTDQGIFSCHLCFKRYKTKKANSLPLFFLSLSLQSHSLGTLTRDLIHQILLGGPMHVKQAGETTQEKPIGGLTHGNPVGNLIIQVKPHHGDARTMMTHPFTTHLKLQQLRSSKIREFQSIQEIMVFH